MLKRVETAELRRAAESIDKKLDVIISRLTVLCDAAVPANDIPYLAPENKEAFEKLRKRNPEMVNCILAVLSMMFRRK